MPRRTACMTVLAWSILAVVGAQPVPKEYPDPTAPEYEEHPEDAELRRDVEAALRQHLDIFWDVLVVKAVDGKVDVFGKVRTEREKRLATTVAEAVPGVTSVANHAIVQKETNSAQAP